MGFWNRFHKHQRCIQDDACLLPPVPAPPSLPILIPGDMPGCCHKGNLKQKLNLIIPKFCLISSFIIFMGGNQLADNEPCHILTFLQKN